MALQQEDLNANTGQATPSAKRSRITIDVSPEMRRRIKLAALQNDLTLGEYLDRILEQAVPKEVSPVQQQRQPATRKMLEELRQLREEIMRDRGGKPFEDSVEMIRQMREERSQYLEEL